MAEQVSIVSGMAGRYALALFELARDSEALDQVSANLKQFDAMVSESEDLRRLVRSPVFTAEEQGKALVALLAKAGISGLAAKFLQLVASKRRLFAVQQMVRDFGKLVDAHKGVTHAEVTAARPLDDAQLKSLKDALAQVSGGKSVEVELKVDPAIIGGLVVRLGSRMVDSSLRTKLNSIRTRMKEVG